MPRRLRVLVLSGLGPGSGCMLRARYLTASLTEAGADARLGRALRTMPFFLDFAVGSVWNLRWLFSPCDVIIGCKPLPSITPLLALSKLIGRVTVLDIDDLDYEYRTGIVRWISRCIQQPFPRQCAVVTYHNENLPDAIQRVFHVPPERLFRLPQGVDLSIFQPGHPLTGSNPRPAGHVVVYPAHLNIASDLDAILEVIRLAHDKLPSLRLIVVGGGAMERHFRSLAKRMGLDGIVQFTGYVHPAKVPHYLAMADAGIAYYKDIEVNRYRASMKLREMLAFGLKVICTSVGESRQFEPFTYQAPAVPERVAELLIRVLTNGGDGRETAGSAFVRDNMNWNTIGKRLYEKLTAVVMARRTAMRSCNDAGYPARNPE